MSKDFVLRIGGEAGWGIATGAELFAELCLSLGYYVFSSKDYSSQIKGGHNYHTVRVSLTSVLADVEKVDLLLALDKRTLEKHQDKVVVMGTIICEDKIKIDFPLDKKIVPLSISKIEEKLKERNIHNAVFLGAAAKVLDIKFERLEKVITNHFSAKKELRELMLIAASEGYTAVKQPLTSFFSNNSKPHLQKEILDGNETISKAALKSGLKFHAQYPMTPVSGILHFLTKEAQKDSSLVVIQPEDEIAVINMALGASYAGSRAMIATSGGGFSLMIESLSLAGMAEIPLVIIEGQRPGPATGLPTKNEQGDLKFILSSGHGEFPKVVIAPGDLEECYTETKRAFYLAEKYQVPVIILVDKHITESSKTVDLSKEEKLFSFDYDKKINICTEVKENQLNTDGLFKRYAQNNLLRTIPGIKRGMFTCAGDEHDEVGGITEDSLVRVQMMNRRMNKLKLIEKELPIPELLGEKSADLTVVSWGSNKGAIIEALNLINDENQGIKKINFINIKYLFPFQTKEIFKILSGTRKLVLIESNYSGQLGELIREKTGIEIKEKILRYDGKTFTVDEIYQKLREMI